jgi:hypothetical protein
MRILIITLFLLTGCAALDQATQDAINCKNDPVCYQLAKGRADMGKEIVGIVNPVAGGVTGALLLTIGLWMGGQ